MHVRVDQAGQHGGASDVESRQPLGWKRIADRGDATLADEDRDLLARRPTGAIEEAGVLDQQVSGRT
jgi:hypothetical protein